jgi:hypothetical protein
MGLCRLDREANRIHNQKAAHAAACDGRSGSALLQLKASESLQLSGTDYVFQLDIRDYNLWMMERMPVFLVLFDAGRRRAYWLHIQGYFQTDPVRRPNSRVRSVRVRVPMRQVINQRAIARMREIKRQEWERLEKEVGL